MTASSLPPHRLRALYDLLIHHQLYYGEVVQFNDPSGIDGYGPPFDSLDSGPSSSPILQSLLQRFVLPLPGISNVSESFWEKIRELMKKFAEANLSDSYDHTGLGLRRTLATGCSAMLEYPARGAFARSTENKQVRERDVDDYDPKDVEDVKEAWEHFLQELVHGDLIDQLFKKIAETDDLSQHSGMVQAAHEHILVNVASVLHHVFIVSSDATYLQKLMSNILSLVPWTMMRQSLRIGNAASMINGITRLFLTKLSIASLTNWVGWTNNPDDGMNLMQQIISTVVGWDIAEYTKHLTTLEKASALTNGPSPEHFKEIRTYLDAPREYQLSLRTKSMSESKSIISVIIAEADLATLSDDEHETAMEYLAFYSSVRNRQQLEKVVCKSQPDVLTQTIREGIAAYEPLIRNVHKVVDLAATNWDLECFLTDFMALFPKQSSIGAADTSAAAAQSVGVEQITSVLRKHQKSLHRFLHTVFKNSTEIADEYRTYVKNAAIQFRSPSPSQSTAAPSTSEEFAGDMTLLLQKLFAGLDEKSQSKVGDALDGYAAYLMALDSVSDDRLRAVLEESSEKEDEAEEGKASAGQDRLPGPGTYLARWAWILGSTPITPLDPTGDVRYGAARVRKPAGKAAANGGTKTPTGSKTPTGTKTPTEANAAPVHQEDIRQQFFWPEPPKDTDVVVSLLSGPFGDGLAEVGRKDWLRAADDVEGR